MKEYDNEEADKVVFVSGNYDDWCLAKWIDDSANGRSISEEMDRGLMEANLIKRFPTLNRPISDRDFYKICEKATKWLKTDPKGEDYYREIFRQRMEAIERNDIIRSREQLTDLITAHDTPRRNRRGSGAA